MLRGLCLKHNKNGRAERKRFLEVLGDEEGQTHVLGDKKAEIKERRETEGMW